MAACGDGLAPKAASYYTCVFAVDTHDAYSTEHSQAPPDHPDAAGWHELQSANRALKEKIEEAWDAAGILTHNGLLRLELKPLPPTAPDPPSPKPPPEPK